MPAQTIISSSQTKILLSFMEQHRDFATGRPNGPQIREEHTRLWDELSILLNAAPGKTKRSGAAWRRFWNEKKYYVRRKIAELNSVSKDGRLSRARLKEDDCKIMSLLSLPLKWEPTDDPSMNDDSSLSAPLDPFGDSEMNIKDESEESHHTPTKVLESEAEVINHTQSYYSEVEPEITVTTEPEHEIHADEPERPPQWAIAIEERRAVASERIATSLEKLTAAVVGMHNSLATLATDVATIKQVLVSRPP